MHISLIIAISCIYVQSYAVEAVQTYDISDLEAYYESLTDDVSSTYKQSDNEALDEQNDTEETSDAQETKGLQVIETALTDIIKSLESEEQKKDVNARNLSFITKTIANYKTLLYHIQELIDGNEDRNITLGYIELCINDIDFLLSENNSIGLDDNTRTLIQVRTNKGIKSGNYEGSVKYILGKIIDMNKQKMRS